MSTSKREPLIDCVRFLAILLMIVFHFIYDLNFFGIKLLPQNVILFWKWLPRLIVFLFMLAVGMSISLKRDGALTRSFHKSQVKIALGALAISIVTYIIYPNRWIYFGTLHCIFFARYIVAFISQKPKLNLLLFFAINVPLFFGFEYPWVTLPHLSMDYIPLFPWVSYAFLGLYLGRNRIVFTRKTIGENKVVMKISSLSFWIYLIHQPVLFGLSYVIYYFLKSS